MNPDHDPPAPRLARPLEWERVDHEELGDVVRIRARSTGAWVHQPAWTSQVLEAVEDGEDVDGIVDRVVQDQGDRYPRREVLSAVGDVIFSLYMEGYVNLPYETPTDPLDARYEVLEELGRGAVGVVWRCHDRTSDAEVAVKHGWDYFLPLTTADAHLQREAQVLQALDHAAVPRLHRTFRTRQRLHIVRDLVDGTPLQEGTLPVAAVAETGVHVADILQHLHERGHLLLDVTPGNFLRRPHDVALIDPGHARVLVDGEVQLDEPVGSPGFRAPEVREERRGVPATDVDGLGRLVFTLVTGRRPGRAWGPDTMGTYLADPELTELVMSLCHDDPRKRPSLQEARAMLGSLRE